MTFLLKLITQQQLKKKLANHKSKFNYESEFDKNGV